ncbi:hypothetical protein D9615_004567 [Tricholomella constricta]|uniref:Allantoicase n=1 Tax=Tricholomella constricta TaxID=117010 RepID=A0A8H5HBS9_9AGAR|nr:hypothetical protein D9615_004567 [Tricholomella constricta]
MRHPAPSMKGQFGSNGALYSGWETRRHNPAHDWCIIRLGTTGTITGFDVDTSHFNGKSGNEAPQVSIEVLHGSPSEKPQANDPRQWAEVLSKVDIGPNSRQLFTIAESQALNYVKLNMYPDGGIARFRVYGHVSPVIPSDASEIFDLAHVFAGGRVDSTSDQHFGVGANLILPGRGKNMGGGWETKRSRGKGHKDWVIIKLGVAGFLEHVDIDTAHFKGNFPESCEIYGLYSDTNINWKTHQDRAEDWTLILSRTKLGPHRQHYLQLENVEGKAFTHVKLTIYPDGGLQRIRIMGRRTDSALASASDCGVSPSTLGASTPPVVEAVAPSSTVAKAIPVLPLTPEAFAPFGKVIQAYGDLTAAPKGTRITPANAGSATKFHKLSQLESSYPLDAGATSGISVYRCQPCQDVTSEGLLELKVLERHPFTNQAFIPMGQGSGEGVKDPGLNYLVVVAQNGADDRPDIQTLRAFVASTAQGIVYDTAIWREWRISILDTMIDIFLSTEDQPMTVLGKAIDFACVETQIGDGSAADCEILELNGAEVVKLRLPKAKRPFSEDEDATATKKRVLTGPNGSPRVNGQVEEQDEPAEGDNLEVNALIFTCGGVLNEKPQLFRKEAIFRRMKHYSREHERSQSRIAELERRKLTCEAGLAAMAACWNQLVKTIRLLVKTEDLPEVADAPEANTDMFDFTVHIRDNNKLDYAKTLEQNMNATQTLVTKLVKAGGDPQAHVFGDNTLTECQKATTECISLQSQIDLIRARLRDTMQQKDEYHDRLLTAENRLARIQSQTVSAIQTREVEKRPESTEEVIEEPQRKPSSPAGSKSPAHPNGICDPTELDALRDQVTARETRIMELEREAALIRDEKALLETDLRLLSYDKITENPHYKTLLDHTGALQVVLNESRAQTSRLSEDLNLLRSSRKEWEDGVISTANQANQELKTMLAKRDSENSRLREQRDQQAAELNERKQQDSVKVASLRELKALAESRSERISALESEVGRCKAQLAAHASHKELMMFFMNGNTEEAAYFESLRDRLASAEKRAAALEESLSKHQADHPDVAKHMKAEADALQKLAEVQAELERYKAVYENPSFLPSDMSTLPEQLRQKEEELQRLRLMDIQHTQAIFHEACADSLLQAETSLYAEIDKLSAAWESLDRQVKDKVFDLSGLEAQVKKAASDKAKSDNKFYAAMRDKDAVEAERSKLSRDVEKQNKVVERLVDTEKNLAAQLVNYTTVLIILACLKPPKSTLEKELSTLRIANYTYKERMEILAEEVNHLKSRFDAEKQHIQLARAAFQDLEKWNAGKRVELRKIEDGLIRTKKELELRKQRETSATHGDHDETELMSATHHPASELFDRVLQRLLKCSTCRTNFRNTVITKCMHKCLFVVLFTPLEQNYEIIGF